MLNGKPRDCNGAKGDFGDARDTRHGNCKPIRPARVIEESLISSKVGLFIFADLCSTGLARGSSSSRRFTSSTHGRLEPKDEPKL